VHWPGHAVSVIAEKLHLTLALLEELGISKIVTGVLSAIALAVFAWLRNNVPLWLGVLIVLFAAYHVTGILHRIQLIRATSKFDPNKYQEFGRNLVTLSEEIFRFLSDRSRDKMNGRPRSYNTTPTAGLADWQADRDFEQVTGRIFFERFGTRVLSSLALLQRLGISAPPHMITIAGYIPHGIPQFLGLIGQLLADGNITEAVDASKDQRFIWQISH
jgi:hypothetical protein